MSDTNEDFLDLASEQKTAQDDTVGDPVIVHETPGHLRTLAATPVGNSGPADPNTGGHRA